MLGSVIQHASDVLVLVALFGLTILIHELGHFLVAIRCGMVVETFSIGFGPAIWKRRIRGVTWKVGIVPVGGYVSLPQLDPSGMATLQGDGEAGAGTPPAELPRTSPWKRILVTIAGPAGNVVLAFVLAWVVYLAPSRPEAGGEGTLIGFVATNSVAHAVGLRAGDRIAAANGEAVATWNDLSMACYLARGRTNAMAFTVRKPQGPLLETALPLDEEGTGIEGVEKSMATVVVETAPGSSAEHAGVKAGDRILEIEGIRVASTVHFVELVNARGGRSVPMLVQRDGKRMELQVTPRHDPERNRAIIGATISTAIDLSVMPWMVHKRPLAQIRGDAAGIVRILKALVTPREARQAAKGLGGPVLILATLWMSIKVSMLNAVGFLRFLNVNLAILNLLPIPVLDGGHVLFSLWEGITRRRAHPRFVNILVNTFAGLLIAVFLLLTVMDVRRSPRLFRAFRTALKMRDNGAATVQEPQGANGK